MSRPVGYMVLLLLSGGVAVVVLIGYVIGGIIFGSITAHVARSKGYDGGFWWGFFLGLIGLLVVGFRPNLNTSTSESSFYVSNYADHTESSISSTNPGSTYDNDWLCECGKHNSNRMNYCVRCRRERSMDSKLPKVTCPHCGAKNKSGNTVCYCCDKPLTDHVATSEKKLSEVIDTAAKSIELIEQLSKLHEQGILTDEEFQEKKAKLLAKM